MAPYTGCATHKNLMLWSMGNLLSGLRYLHNVILKIASWLFSPSNFTSTFSSVSSNKKTWKDFWVGLFNLSLALGMKCVNKNVHLVMQHPSLGQWLKDLPTHLRSWYQCPGLGRNRLYTYVSAFLKHGFMHPKWEGCIVINSLMFVVVCKNVLYCLNLVKEYLWTKQA